MLWGFCVSAGLFAGPAQAADTSHVQLYVGGREYGSVAEYQQDRKAVMALAPAHTVDISKVPVDFPDGKTLTIGPNGKFRAEKGVTVSSETTVTPVISSANTLAAGAGDLRVAGVTPSLGEAVDAFHSGKDGTGAAPTPVYSAADLEEQLRRRLQEAGRPVLIISDKKKVRLMELQDSSDNTGGK